jgi:ketosteroid isomerase-like protein
MNERPRRKSWILIGILCLLLVAHVILRMALPTWQNYSHTEAETTVRKVLDDQVAAWNRGDLEGFMKGYWNSPSLRFYSKNGVTSGWEATIERYRKEYQSEGHEMGHLAFSDLEINPVAPDSAWARGHWQVVTSKETREGVFTLILRRNADGWQIVHDHTSSSQPPAKETKKEN